MRLFLFTVCLLLLSAFRPVIPTVLVGEWVNTDANTKTLTRLIVSENGELHAYAIRQECYEKGQDITTPE